VRDRLEKVLFDRCSVFASGFDLRSACAVAGSDDIDDYAVLDLLDALVRKSLLETIRQFAKDELVGSGAAEQVRAAHATASLVEKPTSSRCGTALVSVKRTNGSVSSWSTFAPPFAGPQAPCCT
jgi:hypothetical protein